MNNLFIIKANILVERVNRTFRIPDPYAMTILDIKNLRCIDGGGITMSNTIKVLGELLPQNGKEIIKCISMLKIIFLRKYQRSLYSCKYFILTIVWSSFFYFLKESQAQLIFTEKTIDTGRRSTLPNRDHSFVNKVWKLWHCN